MADPEIADLYRRMLALRRELPPGDVDEIAFDADVPSLRVTRGPWTLVCNFREMTGEIVGPGYGGAA